MASERREWDPAPIPCYLPGIVATLAVCWVLGLLACSDGSESELSPPPRIILVSMDTVRADLVDGYGATGNTPVLAEIATDGILFRNSYAASTYTIPSHMSAFTGLDPVEHGVLSEDSRLDPEVPVLAEMLQAAGYRTQAFHEGGYVAARFGFDRGFDGYSQLKRLAVVEERLDSILDWIRSASDKPYFLFLHTYAAHFPYGGLERVLAAGPHSERFSDTDIERWRELARTEQIDTLSEEERWACMVLNHLAVRRSEMVHACGHRLPPEFMESDTFEADRDAMLSSYRERIRKIDTAIGRIRDTLIELDQWDDTLLIVMSDHGEAFFEHGRQRHGYVPFNEVLKVPLILSYPALLRKRDTRIVDGLVWHLDILPTVSSLVGVPLATRPTGGLDLVPVMMGDEYALAGRDLHPTVLHAAHVSDEPMKRITLQGPLKYVQGHPQFGDELGLLFDLDRDPHELENLRSNRAVDFESLAEASDSYSSTLKPGYAPRQTELETGAGDEPGASLLSEEAEEQLRELGYIE